MKKQNSIHFFGGRWGGVGSGGETDNILDLSINTVWSILLITEPANLHYVTNEVSAPKGQFCAGHWITP